jgi:hypothetical protein
MRDFQIRPNLGCYDLGDLTEDVRLQLLCGDSIGLNVTKLALLFLRQFPDSATHDEGRGFAIVPCHKGPVSPLAVPHFWGERRVDSAVRAVYVGIAVLGVDLLNPRASPQRSGRWEAVGA